MGGKMKKKLPIILVLLLLTAIILACGSSKSYKQFTGGHEFGEDQRAYRSNLNPVEVYGYSFEVYDEYFEEDKLTSLSYCRDYYCRDYEDEQTGLADWNDICDNLKKDYKDVKFSYDERVVELSIIDRMCKIKGEYADIDFPKDNVHLTMSYEEERIYYKGEYLMTTYSIKGEITKK